MQPVYNSLKIRCNIRGLYDIIIASNNKFPSNTSVYLQKLTSDLNYHINHLKNGIRPLQIMHLCGRQLLNNLFTHTYSPSWQRLYQSFLLDLWIDVQKGDYLEKTQHNCKAPFRREKNKDSNWKLAANNHTLVHYKPRGEIPKLYWPHWPRTLCLTSYMQALHHSNTWTERVTNYNPTWK